MGRRRLAGGGQLANSPVDDFSWGDSLDALVECVDEVEVCAQGLVDRAAPRWLAVTWIVQNVDDGVELGSVRRFSDVGDDHPYVAYIERAAELGITQGCGDGSRFCPDDMVTQAQMAAFLVRGLTATEVVEPEMVVTVSSVEPVSVSQADPVPTPVPQENPVVQDDPAPQADPIPQEVPVAQETGDMLRHEFYYVDRVGLEALEVVMDVLANDECVTTCSNVTIKYAPKVGTTTWDANQQRLMYSVPEGTALPGWAVAIGYETDTSPWNAIVTIVFNEIPDPGYQDIAVGDGFWCAVTGQGAIECEGDNSSGQTNVPNGTDFVSVFSGDAHSCAIRTNGSVTCWGSNLVGESADPSGTFKMLGLGLHVTCGLKTDNTLACQGASHGSTDLPGGTHKSLSMGQLNGCSVTTDNDLTCWGEVGANKRDVPPDKAKHVTTSGVHSCAIKLDDTLTCWGSNTKGQADSQSEMFKALAAGGQHTCGIKTDDTIFCWGNNDNQQTMSPDGTFSAISAYADATCALTMTGQRECWGTLS